MGPQPILVDGRLVILRAKNLLQIRPIQADGVGCHGERLDFEKVLPVHKVGPEDGVVESVRLRWAETIIERVSRRYVG
jgi:hypothetical protein